MYLWYSKPPTISDDELTQEGLTIIDQEHLESDSGRAPGPNAINWKADFPRRSDTAPAELVSETIERQISCNHFSFPKRNWPGRLTATIAGIDWLHSS